MEENDPKASFYRDEIEDVGSGEYPLEDPMTFWNDEKKMFWKKMMGRSETPFVLLGILLVVVVIVFLTLLMGGGRQETSYVDPALEERMLRLEETLGDMQLRIEQIGQVEQELELVKKTVAGSNGSVVSVSAQVERITGELASLKEEMAKIKKSVSAAAMEQKTTGAQAVYYEVKKGDTLYSISRRYDVSVAAIREKNGLSETSSIQPGQKLRVR